MAEEGYSAGERTLPPRGRRPEYVDARQPAKWRQAFERQKEFLNDTLQDAMYGEVVSDVLLRQLYAMHQEVLNELVEEYYDKAANGGWVERPGLTRADKERYSAEHAEVLEAWDNFIGQLNEAYRGGISIGEAEKILEPYAYDPEDKWKDTLYNLFISKPAEFNKVMQAALAVAGSFSSNGSLTTTGWWPWQEDKRTSNSKIDKYAKEVLKYYYGGTFSLSSKGPVDKRLQETMDNVRESASQTGIESPSGMSSARGMFRDAPAEGASFGDLNMDPRYLGRYRNSLAASYHASFRGLEQQVGRQRAQRALQSAASGDLDSAREALRGVSSAESTLAGMYNIILELKNMDHYVTTMSNSEKMEYNFGYIYGNGGKDEKDYNNDVYDVSQWENPSEVSAMKKKLQGLLDRNNVESAANHYTSAVENMGRSGGLDLDLLDSIAEEQKREGRGLYANR